MRFVQGDLLTRPQFSPPLWNPRFPAKIFISKGRQRSHCMQWQPSQCASNMAPTSMGTLRDLEDVVRNTKADASTAQKFLHAVRP